CAVSAVRLPFNLRRRVANQSNAGLREARASSSESTAGGQVRRKPSSARAVSHARVAISEFSAVRLFNWSRARIHADSGSFEIPGSLARACRSTDDTPCGTSAEAVDEASFVRT